MLRAIDRWLNVTMGEQKPPEHGIRAKKAGRREGVLDEHANAERLFFAPRSSQPSPQAAARRRAQ